jgi:hypothetical protein
MKRFTRTACLLAALCPALLAGCGGSSGNLYLGGYVDGLYRNGLVLENEGNGDTVTLTAGQSQFVFPKLLGNDQGYKVTVKTQPEGEHCDIVHGSGHTTAYDVQTVEVHCLGVPHDLAGTVTGLRSSMTVVNGSDKLEIAPDPAGNPVSFKMKQVAEGFSYALLILTPPAGQTCALANNVGTMGPEGASNVQITCQ